MATNFGGVACTFLRGTFPAKGERAHVWTLPGFNGYGILLLGSADSDGELEAVLYSTDAGCDAWYASLKALQGSITTATNDQGDVGAGLYVVQVTPLVKEAGLIPGTTTTTKGMIGIRFFVI